MPQLRVFAITNLTLDSISHIFPYRHSSKTKSCRMEYSQIECLLRYLKLTHWVQTDPLSLTTLLKSFNMAVLFQPSKVLKPNPPSSFGLYWTSGSYGSYRWVRGLTKRNPECSMKRISRAFSGSPKADDQEMWRLASTEEMSSILPAYDSSLFFHLLIRRLNLSKRRRQSECLNLVDTRGSPQYLRGSCTSRKPRVLILSRLTL